MKIFPCENYIQQHKSPFDADYKKTASYDVTRFKPCFILIDEGGFSSLLDNGDISDCKILLEGGGKALKLKF